MDTDDLYRLCLTFLLWLGILTATFSPDAGAALFMENPLHYENEAGIHVAVEDEFHSSAGKTVPCNIGISQKPETGTLFQEIRFPVKYGFIVGFMEWTPLQMERFSLRC